MMMTPAFTSNQKRLFICLGEKQLFFLTCMEFLFDFEFQLKEMEKKEFKYYYIF
jgi:hypothetical protein